MSSASHKSPFFWIAPAFLPFTVAIGSIHPDPDNSNVHPDAEIEQLCRSLALFGQASPIIIRSDGRIIKGNGTYKAALTMGATEIAAIVREDLNDAEMDAYGIADNAIGRMSHFDEERLKAKIAELAGECSEEMPEIPGLSDEELARLFGENETEEQAESEKPTVTTEGNQPDTISEIEDAIEKAETSKSPARCVIGDVWHLPTLDGKNRHIVVCGDSTQPDVMAELMDGHRAALIVTDPPYGDNARGCRDQDRIKKGIKFIANDTLTGQSLIALLRDSVCKVPLLPSASVYVFHSWRHQYEFLAAFRPFPTGPVLKHRSTIVWDKKNMGLNGGAGYRDQQEMCLFLTHGSDYRWYGGKGESNVWPLARHYGERPANHPTPKPLSVWRKPFENSSKEGDHVADPFGGHGPTLIVAETLSRIAHVAELDEKYCDFMLEWYFQKTGIEPIKAKNLLTKQEIVP